MILIDPRAGVTDSPDLASQLQTGILSVKDTDGIKSLPITLGLLYMVSSEAGITINELSAAINANKSYLFVKDVDGVKWSLR